MTNHGRINVAAFSSLMDDLRYNIERNRNSLATALKRSPNMAYKKVNELALFVGSRHNVNLQLHFPAHNTLPDVGSDGTETGGIVVDKFRKTFPTPREMLEQKALALVGSEARPQDA